MSSWWEKKLGGGSPAPPPTPRPSPYAGVLPQGMGTQHDRALQHYFDRQGIEMTPAAPPAQAPPQRISVAQVGPNEIEVPVNPSAPMIDGDPHQYHRRFWGWTGNPRGGAKETQTTGECPNCGSPRFFSRSGNAVMNKDGVQCVPKPECFECGYPNEQGTLGYSGGAIKTLPGSKGARQFSVREAAAPDNSIATLVKY